MNRSNIQVRLKTLSILFVLGQDLLTTALPCSSNYTLKLDGDCVKSSYDQYISCVSLSDHFESFNSKPVSDCIQFILEPGEYILSEGRISYNIVISSALLDTATISCFDVETKTNNYEYSAPLSFTGDKMSVILEQLSFQGCNRPFEFEELSSVVIHSCSFW